MFADRRSASVTEVPFVGRDAEFRVLRACLADAGHGRGHALLLGGEPGIGKTRIVEAAIAEARARGFAIAPGACDPGAGMPEYWPWLQVHRALTAPAEAPRLTPDVGSPDQRRFGLFDAAARGLARRARREPILIVLEDLHWADRSSLLLLEFLVPRFRDVAIALLATYRDLDVVPEHPLYAALAALSRHAHTERLLLRGLEHDELARLVAAAAGIT